MGSNIKVKLETGNVAVTKVEFLNWGSKLKTVTAAPFEFSWAAPLGAWQLQARVTLQNGSVMLTETSNIDVYWSDTPAPNGEAPTVSIVSPVGEVSVGMYEQLVFEVETNDNDGTVQRVEFYNWGTKIGESSTYPFNFTWSNLPLGGWNITARAFDNDGNQSQLSNSISVDVYWQNKP